MKPTAEQTMQWAREAGATRDHPVHLPNLWTIDTEGFQQLVALAYAAGAAAERERCVDAIPPQYFELRDRIRALGDDE